MKTITKITVQQSGERYNLFLDEEFFCGVSEDTLIKLNLKKGMQLDEATLEILAEEENKNKCFSYAVYLLGGRNYFEKALRDKLRQKEYTEEAIDFTVEKLKKYKYIDDEKLTAAFISDKKRFSKKGPRYIAQALKMKGVDGETIKTALEEGYDNEEAYENCRALAIKKYDYYKRKSEDKYTFKGKMYGFLAQRGFNSEIIRKVLEGLMEEEIE
nr:RecX family transcriptional regulator [uncultured Cellulosilyticum sp.]